MYTRFTEIRYTSTEQPAEIGRQVILVFGPLTPYSESFQIYYSGNSGEDDAISNYNKVGLLKDEWIVRTKDTSQLDIPEN